MTRKLGTGSISTERDTMSDRIKHSGFEEILAENALMRDAIIRLKMSMDYALSAKQSDLNPFIAVSTVRSWREMLGREFGKLDSDEQIIETAQEPIRGSDIFPNPDEVPTNIEVTPESVKRAMTEEECTAPLTMDELIYGGPIMDRAMVVVVEDGKVIPAFGPMFFHAMPKHGRVEIGSTSVLIDVTDPSKPLDF